MKIKTSLDLIHKIFSACIIAIFAMFLGFLGYLYVNFNDTLVGDVKAGATQDPLTYLNVKKFELALVRMQLRMSLPDVPADLHDPYLPPPGTP
jgi:hypothetical protein